MHFLGSAEYFRTAFAQFKLPTNLAIGIFSKFYETYLFAQFKLLTNLGIGIFFKILWNILQ